MGRVVTAMSSASRICSSVASTKSPRIDLRRGGFGKAEDVAYAALFLASEESSHITGTDNLVDGGWFPPAPYLVNERSHHALSLMDKKEHLEEFLHRFR